MRFAAILAACLCTLQAEPWPLERLFHRPYAWGTTPQRAAWSKHGHVLVFLWNAGGGRFLDLYAYHPDGQSLVRLTNLEPLDDPINRPPAARDDRQKHYLEPPAGIGDFDISENGTRAAFSYHGDLYLVNTSGRESPFRLTRTKTPESNPAFSPDGQKLAFTREGQLFVQDLGNGQLWQVTEIAGEGAALGGWHWSPDGKRFVYTVRSGAGRKLLLANYSGRVVTAEPFARTLPGDPAPEVKAYVVSADGGTPTEMNAGPWGHKVFSFGTPKWSYDSRLLLSTAVHPNLKQAALLVNDAGTGTARVLAEDKDAAWVEPFWATWSPDSSRVLFLSERDGWSHLYVVPKDGGDARQLTHGAWEVIFDRPFGHEPQWAGDYIYYASTEAGTAERQFYRIRADGSGKQRLSEREGLNIGIVSEDGQDVAMMQADVKNPFDLYVGGRRATVSPQPDFAGYAWPDSRFITFPSRGDHEPVAARLFLPHGYNPDDRSQKPRPAVFFIHGAGYATSVLKQWGAYAEVRYVFNCSLVHRGYVVLDLDYRGSSGYGRDWRTGVYLHMGGPDLDDVLGGIDYLRSLGNIDMRRIGIWGSSYGGFMTAMAMFASPDTFRAGASFSSVNDWENYNAYYTEQRLNTPQQNPEAYRRSSPIHFSGLLENPFLMVHGIVDNNVMFQDTVQLSEKLVHEGKHFSEIYYPEESHIFQRDETWIDAFGRATEFFERNLGQP
ncbi:MAG TPA: prolyl oligopeptidase family serine peptidase [Bryobacteraceae bacterium]|nr:prolyl oligopeptidase family serine peptidase [Bryobacteraceae bacterium]